MGLDVVCVDRDEAKIAALRRNEIPIYEPGLEALVADGARQGRLTFAASIAEVAASCTVFMIAVGTPSRDDGGADLRFVDTVAAELGQHIAADATVVTKSTVPVGTADRVREIIHGVLRQRAVGFVVEVVSNPEFLKEGDAINDFKRPDRIIVGVDSARARAVMEDLYAPFTRNHPRLMVMGVRDAEMTKYAANAMLATRISFMNELSNVCEQLGVDVEMVRLGIGSDARIGYSFIYPGCGYGGSCFPKDVRALVAMARDVDVDAQILRAVDARNEAQKHHLVRRLIQYFGADLRGRRFALWGLAFKPGTDDMREAPSLVVLADLIEAGASVAAFDPVAIETARQQLPAEWERGGKLVFGADQYGVLHGADALLLVTEWKPFRHPNFERIKVSMKQPVIFDGRNQYEPARMRELGFHYFGIGRAA
jgi:UDPglucose 6-dehydrogenase